MKQPIIEALHPEEVAEASRLLCRAYATSPFSIGMYKGKKVRRRCEGEFRIALRRKPGRAYVAKEAGQIVGAMRMVRWPQCRMRPLQGIVLLPAMIMAAGVTLPRVLRFVGQWAKHDPDEPHWHLGLIGVAPERQRQGIGSSLLSRFCEEVDDTHHAAYLESDRKENVRLYERFGFSVTRDLPVYGVQTWLMWRAPRGGPLKGNLRTASAQMVIGRPPMEPIAC